MAAWTLAFALGALFIHQLTVLPDLLYVGLAPLLLPMVLRSVRPAVGVAFCLGMMWTTLNAHLALERRLPDSAQASDVVVDGRVVSVSHSNAERVRFVVAVEQMVATPRSETRLRRWKWRGCTIVVSWYRPEAHSRPRAGERWRTALRLRQPRGLRNAGGFDSEHRALREGRCALGYVRGGSVPLQLDGTRHSLNRLREDTAQRISSHLRDAPIAGVIVALAVGLRERIAREHRSVMQATGTAHLMAISGLHIGLVAGLGMLLGRRAARCVPSALLLRPSSHWGALLAILFAVAYAALAGFAIPTQRALLMLVVYLGAMVLGRRTARHHGLALALLVVLLIDPLAIRDPGTWLSFVAVAGLLWAIGPRMPDVHDSGDVSHSTAVQRPAPATAGSQTLGARLARAVDGLHLAVRVQLAASLIVVPLTIAAFAWHSLLAPLANLFAIPVTGFLVVPLTLLAVGVEPLWPAFAGLLLWFAAGVMEIVFDVLQWLPAAQFGVLPARAPDTGALLAAGTGVALVLSPMAWRLRAVGLLWLAPLLIPASSAPPTRGLDVHVLDVGQGLAVVVRTERHSLVFDAGPAWSNGHDAGAGVVVPALRRQGLGRVDRIVISHSHQDHAGGLSGLRRAMPDVAVLGDPGGRSGSGLQARPCRAGQQWSWDGYRFAVLHPGNPSESARSIRNAVNNGSCVLRIDGPGGSVLIPADIEAPTEIALSNRDPARLRAQVMLVPHHGSRSSSTAQFLQAVTPQIAINSSGHRNRFSLPSAEVVARYREMAIPLLDTACVGAIHLRLQAERAPTIHTWYQNNLRFWHSRDRAAHCSVAGSSD